MHSASFSMHIAIFVPSLRGGGAERVMLTLANAFAERGHKVDLVLAKAEGPYLPEVAERVRVIDLGAPRVLRALWPLYRYLRSAKPDSMLSALNYANVIAIIAWKLARVPTYLAVSERSSLAIQPERLIGKITRYLMRSLYPKADKVICVSKGIEGDMQRLIGVSSNKTVTIYNPVDVDAIQEKMNAPLDHPWFNAKAAPVVLAAGRLTEAKDYPTLLKAFAQLRKGRDVRLVILGQGEEETKLRTLAKDLGIARDVDFAGFHGNPFAWMARCDLFVISSAWEGFPNVLVQAMACGTPIVSTNCRTGPDEILENGKWGRLVPVGDENALCMAMAKTLTEKAPAERMARLKEFRSDTIVGSYESALLCSVVNKPT